MFFLRIRRLLMIFAVSCIVLSLTGVCIRYGLSFFYPSLQIITTPSKAIDRNTVVPSITVVNLPISISVKSLREAAEKYVPLVYIDIDEDPTDLLTNDNLKYELKRGSIDMSIHKNGIAFSFPVTGTVKLDGKINLKVVKIDTSAHGNVEGIISGTIAFNILPDWRIEPDLQFKVDILKAKIPVKRLGKISLRSFLEKRLSDKIKRKRKKLTAKVMDKNIIRDKVTEIWTKMHRTELLNAEPKVWANVIPLKVGFMSLAASKDVLQTGLRLSLKTSLFICEKPPIVQVTALPDADILKKSEDTFNIKIPFQIDSVTLNRYIEKKVIGFPRQIAKDVSITVKRAEILSSGENQLSAILFADIKHARLGLNTNCRFYINGKVFNDTSKNEIRFTSINYDASFSRWWVSVLHWVASPYLLYELENRLVLSIGRELEKAHDKLTKEVQKLVIPQGIKADLSVNPPKLILPGVNRQGFFGELQLDGSLSAILDLSRIKPYKKKSRKKRRK